MIKPVRFQESLLMQQSTNGYNWPFLDAIALANPSPQFKKHLKVIDKTESGYLVPPLQKLLLVLVLQLSIDHFDHGRSIKWCKEWELMSATDSKYIHPYWSVWRIPMFMTNLAGGDNWGKKHDKLHRSTLFVQLLPQTGKAQSVTPQTTKYTYRTVTF